jgi:hypothetical protein
MYLLQIKVPEMESEEFSDEFSEFSSPLPCGLQRGDSNLSWNPLSQVLIYVCTVFYRISDSGPNFGHF